MAVVADVRRNIAACLVSRIEQDIAAKLLPAGTRAATLAGLTLAVVQGMSVLARDEVPRERILALAAQAILAWPKQERSTTPS